MHQKQHDSARITDSLRAVGLQGFRQFLKSAWAEIFLQLQWKLEKLEVGMKARP